MPSKKKEEKSVELGEFEGKTVSAVKIIVTKTGDGLSQAMDVEPRILHQGDVGYIVMSYVAEKIRFDPIKGEEDDVTEVNRVQILAATGATFVDKDLIGDVVEQMRARIAEFEEQQRLEREAAKGVMPLPLD